MRFKKRRAGFTIVEVMIVIAVIGILAAIATVSYKGAQERTRDEAVMNRAGTVIKSAQARYSANSTYGYSGDEPSTKKEVLETYNLMSLVDEVHVYGYDPNGQHGEKSKVHMSIDVGVLDVGYWSNDKKAWVRTTLHDSDGVETFESQDPPAVPPQT